MPVTIVDDDHGKLCLTIDGGPWWAPYQWYKVVREGVENSRLESTATNSQL